MSVVSAAISMASVDASWHFASPALVAAAVEATSASLHCSLLLPAARDEPACVWPRLAACPSALRARKLALALRAPLGQRGPSLPVWQPFLLSSPAFAQEVQQVVLLP